MPEQDQRTHLTEMLANWHIESASIDSPRAAIEVIKWSVKVGRPFSFALIDSAAAVEDQSLFMKDLQTQPDLASLPVIVVDVAGASEGTAHYQLEGSHAQARIDWPVSQSALLQVISGLHASMQDTSHSIRALASVLNPEITTRSAGAMWAAINRILVAEDNPANQELILALLETKTSVDSVRIVNNGAEALKVASKEHFDLILMDIQMPVLGGLEATAEIRRLEKARGVHTPIIALTAKTMKGDKESYLSGGMDGFVSKPIDPATMFLEIQRVMQSVAPITAA